MATVPRDARLAQGGQGYELRPGMTMSPGGGMGRSDQQMKSFTTDDLPAVTKPLLPPKKPFVGAARDDMETSSTKSEEMSMRGSRSSRTSFSKEAMADLAQANIMRLKRGISTLNTESVTKLSAVIVEKVKNVQKTFTMDESERILRTDWMVLETEDGQLNELKEVISKLEAAFQFSKASPLVTLATDMLKRCDALTDRSIAHVEQCQLMFSQCSNDISTLQDYLGKLRDAIQPAAAPRDQNGEKRVARRAEWAVSRMAQSTRSLVVEMRENLAELDDMITECTKLMVQTITLLHMRTQSADFSGTGVAAGAAGMVAGALVAGAGLIAAPVTGGLSVPISIAGKGLFFTGAAALTPSTIMLARHNQQLHGLAKLADHLKCRLEIMNQKRLEMSIACAAGEDLDVNIKLTGNFCQDAVELDVSPYESVWPFVEPIAGKLATLESSVTLFLASPSLWHYCQAEDALAHYVLPDPEDE